MSTRAHTVPRFYLGGFTQPEVEANREPYVWVGSISSGAIDRRAPKNLSTIRGYYDGRGGFEDETKSIESHLSSIESEAAFAIRRLVAGSDVVPSAAIWRFLAWQAARTPGWFKLVEAWANEPESGEEEAPLEPPPAGIDKIKDRHRSQIVEHPSTHERREVQSVEELKEYRRGGWRWILSSEDRLEAMHMQAWYFQVRHFPRLKWTPLTSPQGEYFITSDRGVGWLVDGYVDTPPSALKHPAAQVVAPLTRTIALVGRNESSRLEVTPRHINRFVAATAREWIAGPSREVVGQALWDRDAAEKNVKES